MQKLLPLLAWTLVFSASTALAEIRVQHEGFTPQEQETVSLLFQEVLTDFPDLMITAHVTGGGQRSGIYAATNYFPGDDYVTIRLYQLFWTLSRGGKRSTVGHELVHGRDFLSGRNFFGGPCESINTEIRALQWERDHFSINKPTPLEKSEVFQFMFSALKRKKELGCLW